MTMASSSRSRHVLIVDDEAPIRKLLSRLLERRGFDVLEAETAEAALAITEATSLALVLCDVRMPTSNGVDLYRTIMARHPDLAQCFVFITGDRSTLEGDGLLRDIPVLVKPFSAADLHALLAALGLEESLITITYCEFQYR